MDPHLVLVHHAATPRSEVAETLADVNYEVVEDVADVSPASGRHRRFS